MINTLAVISAATIPSLGWAIHARHLRRQLRAARHDPLTGLWTRPGFTARAERLLARGDTLVVFADADDFKSVNDVWGHAVGDSALKAVASRLARWGTTRGGVAARLGGDEFVAAIPAPPDNRADALIAELGPALRIDLGYTPSGSPRGHMWCSVGAAQAPRGSSLTDALAGADSAMYQAKALGEPVIGSVTATEPRRASRRGIPTATAHLEARHDH